LLLSATSITFILFTHAQSRNTSLHSVLRLSRSDSRTPLLCVTSSQTPKCKAYPYVHSKTPLKSLPVYALAIECFNDSICVPLAGLNHCKGQCSHHPSPPTFRVDPSLTLFRNTELADYSIVYSRWRVRSERLRVLWLQIMHSANHVHVSNMTRRKEAVAELAVISVFVSAECRSLSNGKQQCHTQRCTKYAN
jgi:hypothetical protein